MCRDMIDPETHYWEWAKNVASDIWLLEVPHRSWSIRSIESIEYVNRRCDEEFGFVAVYAQIGYRVTDILGYRVTDLDKFAHAHLRATADE